MKKEYFINQVLKELEQNWDSRKFNGIQIKFNKINKNKEWIRFSYFK